MTALEKLCRANRWRIRKGMQIGRREVPEELVSDETAGWNGDFLVPLEGQIWHVRISDGMGWRHLSVTNAQKASMLASWGIMCRLKDAFFADDSWVIQFHPAKDDNINDHPYCLHLWEPLDEPLPKPPIVMV